MGHLISGFVMGMLVLAACGGPRETVRSQQLAQVYARTSGVTYPANDFARPTPIEVGQYVVYGIRHGGTLTISTYEILGRANDRSWRVHRHMMSEHVDQRDTFLVNDRELPEICHAPGTLIVLGQRYPGGVGPQTTVVGGVFKGTTMMSTEVKLNGRLHMMQGLYNAAVPLTGLISGKTADFSVELLEFGRFRTAMEMR
ncbi:MAG: hypothetical protein MUC47_00565 [Candidatus Kapabacteria bacterium]|jgi:hypothetical protein|nr:hypothetical protein [Candidatus Kapabacteria bacterium]